jgi:oligopeptide transport system substrate-binding protein
VRLGKRSAALIGAGIAGAMVLSACGGSEEPTDEGTEGGEAATGGTYSLEVGEPENPLVPGNTAESEGAQIIDSLWTGLVNYTPDGAIEYTGMAESIESEDNTTWTITLKDGWTFHDGTEVTAQSFVDTWNYTAYSPNAQGGSYFLSKIEGYDDLQAPTDDAGEATGDPAAEEMSGLEVVDDLTFNVTLSAPFAQFPVTVGYSAFHPMPASFFEDPEAVTKADYTPVGTGPFKADGPLEPGVGITLSRYEDYPGENPAQADTLEYRIYADINTAYTDVQGGNLDITSKVPPDAIATVRDEFGDRYFEAESSSFTYVGFPIFDERWSDPRVRQAFSMAIDREAITEAIFEGTRSPAYSAVAPTIEGWREDACQYCTLDPERANQLLDEAGFDRSEPVELWFNAGAGHEAWMEAVGNQLRENLGIEEYTLQGDLDFAEYLPLLEEGGASGPFRLGWGMDYPSMENFLGPLYSEAGLPPAGSNYPRYSNEEFESLLEQGNTAASNEEAIAFYQQAEDILLEEMPIAPIFYGLEQGAHSDKVSNVSFDIFGVIDTSAVTVNQ